MSTTVSDSDRVTCTRCEDVVPDTLGWKLSEVWHCLPCAEEIVRLELLQLAAELS
jgi:hypothetical protein